jgi:aryl-alcohol dehydrogenase-like predicted oxidoreductase
MHPHNYEEKVAIYDRYVELGGNIVDMSHCYGKGACASALGRWFKERSLGHEDVMLFEKGCHPYGSPRVTPEFMQSDLDEELAALGRERVEFWTFHRDDPAFPVEPLVEKAASLTKEGKVGFWGGSNWTVERIQDWNRAAAAGHGPAMTHNNPNLSLATVNEPMWEDCLTIDQEGKDWHEKTQFPLFSWSSTGGGWFARVESQDVNRVYNNPVNQGRRERLEEMAKAKDALPVQIALAYTLSHPFPVWALVGPHTVQQMDELAAGAAMRLTPAEMAWLEDGEGA